MKHFFTLLFLVFSSFSFSQTFELADITLPQLSFSTASLGDVDGDGDMDLYLGGLDDNGAVVGGLYIFADGNYTLSNVANLPAVFLGASQWGDMDNDGDIDIAIMGSDASFVDITRIYKNNGDGTFTNLNLGLDPIEQGSIAWVDMDGDNDLDLSYSGIGFPDRLTRFYTNNGDDTFTELIVADVPGLNIGQIKWADYNNDGNQDFFIAGFDDNSGGTQNFYSKLFSGNGDGTFTPAAAVFHPGWLGEVEWIDYNADGQMDLLISGAGGAGDERFTLMYKNNGGGSFTELDLGFPAVSHSSLEWQDFDLDGDMDLFITGVTTTPGDGNNVSTVFRNDGDDVFTDMSVEGLTTSYFGEADAGDIDGDGRPDVVITGYDGIYTSNTAVYFNTTLVGIAEEVKKMELNIYPNPTSDRIHISMDHPIDTSVKIYDSMGRCVQTFQTTNINQTIDLKELSPGLYVLSIGAYSTRLVIE